VDADLLTRLTVLVERGAIDARGPKALPKALRPVLGVDGLALGVHEDEALGARVATLRGELLAPRHQGTNDIRTKCPGAGVVGLVLVERHRAALEVHVGPTERRGFTDTHALAGEESVEHAIGEGDHARAKEFPFLVGVEVALRLAGACPGEPTAGKRVRLTESERVDRHREQTVECLPHVTA
jgi:hypothetical protein